MYSFCKFGKKDKTATRAVLFLMATEKSVRVGRYYHPL